MGLGLGSGCTGLRNRIEGVRIAMVATGGSLSNTAPIMMTSISSRWFWGVWLFGFGLGVEGLGLGGGMGVAG